ncbi:PREDICTED: glutathione S-transferase T3-like [Brassica oleracea var. oleracea]|uniref:glutathione S-transferase T3-like n=1 Tax=Brassica oleracea var. oleracea TaxID=109376 RepID=UPI0006A6E5D3|nr:PREDICTED: glutathione S-transferase T3-like [Brassica oleracea var. oleracea]
MDSTNFVELLNSQQDTIFPETFPYARFSHGGEHGSSQLPTETSSFCEESPTKRRGRRKWTVSDDLVLISAWLNTSKDPLVGNEQKARAFWQRIAEYYAASPKVERGEKIEPIQCKQRQKTSGQSETDIVKMAHTIFANDHKTKFNLHHAWEELRHDQKWCEAATHKITGSSKKRKCDGAQSDGATSPLCDQATQRPPGVKAAKAASGKRSIGDHQEGKGTAEFQTMWSIKERDLIVKERLSKQRLLESLISKKDPLSEAEEALKQKLINRVFEDV